MLDSSLKAFFAIQVINLSMTKAIQCSKAKEKILQFWKLLAVVLDTHIDKVHKGIESTLAVLPLN